MRTALFVIVLLLLGYPHVASGKISERERIVEACARDFGTAVDQEQNLFEINESFVLQLKFNKGGLLTEAAVKPKYFFNESHPDWLEPRSFPLLSWSAFEKLLVRLEKVKPKGKLTKKANTTAIVTNSTGYFKESYAHGVLEWGEVGIGFRGSKENGVRFFTVRYFRGAR
jgi:hypothetical protein